MKSKKLIRQIFDEGHLTDSKGVTVDFRNTIIIMTSNLASEVLQADENSSTADKKVWEVLHKHFKPEFLNRLSGVIMFNSLSPKDLLQISEQQLKRVQERMQENNIELKISDDLALHFAEIGYDPIFGARPLRRVIEEKLIDEIAMRMIEGTVKPGDTLEPKVKDGNIVI